MSGDAFRDAVAEAVISAHSSGDTVASPRDAATYMLAKPQMEAIKSFLLRYAETQSAATAGTWNDSPRDVLEAVLGDEGQSVIDWVLDEEARRG